MGAVIDGHDVPAGVGSFLEGDATNANYIFTDDRVDEQLVCASQQDDFPQSR